MIENLKGFELYGSLSWSSKPLQKRLYCSWGLEDFKEEVTIILNNVCVVKPCLSKIILVGRF
jgi:hypothetical protein